MKGQKNKSYLTIGLIQLITIITFTATMYFMFTKESVILNPIPYTAGIGADCAEDADLLTLTSRETGKRKMRHQN